MLPTTMTTSDQGLNDLSDYFHAAPIGLHIATSDGTIIRTNLAELELLGYGSHEDEYVGHHFAEFYSDPESMHALLDRLIAGQTIAEHETTLLRRDGKPQRVLIYANARIEDANFRGVRWFTFPHPDDLRPDIAEVGALKDESVGRRKVNLTQDERDEMYRDLLDFFENSPVSLHIVGGDGLIKRASKSELASMGYDSGSYIGQHIARFHADQKVIDGMLEDLVGGTPLVNFNATLFRKDGSKFPVMIYSNSRMQDGSFVNTRCFTVPALRAPRARTRTVEFSWPRNEDFGFTPAGSKESDAQVNANPMTLALKYIASRKRPEESLGFLAHVSKTLGSNRPFEEMLHEAVSLCVPYLADFASVDLTTENLLTVSSTGLQSHAGKIIQLLGDGRSDTKLSFDSARTAGKVVACFDLSAITDENAASLLKLGINSALIAPLEIRGEHVGTLTLLRENAPQRRNFGPADEAMIEELGRRISFSIEIENYRRRG